MKLLSRFINIVFPPFCVNCRRGTGDGVVLCHICSMNISLNQTLFCGKCGLRLAANQKVCHKDFPHILGAATDYKNDAVKELVHGLKFRFLRKAAEPLAGFLANYANNLAIPLREYVVMPVPLSAARLRKRGFNQSELIAEIFSERLGLPLETKILLRTKNTKPQSETKGFAEREENVRGCFTVKHPELVRGKNIILMDDVTTSGATLYEAAAVLKSSGAKKIIALAAARA